MRLLCVLLLSSVALAQPKQSDVTLKSGVVYTPLKVGTGPSPRATDTVRVNYRGTFTDGREFDSSYKSKDPATFKLNTVIACWTEGLQQMKVGGKATLLCPPATAYAERGAGSVIPPNSALLFEIELVEIKK